MWRSLTHGESYSDRGRERASLEPPLIELHEERRLSNPAVPHQDSLSKKEYKTIYIYIYALDNLMYMYIVDCQKFLWSVDCSINCKRGLCIFLLQCRYLHSMNGSPKKAFYCLDIHYSRNKQLTLVDDDVKLQKNRTKSTC